MIKVLQSAHLKLEGIREVISGMIVEEMEIVLDDLAYTDQEWNTDAVHNWLTGKPNVASSEVASESVQDFGFFH